MIKSYSSYAHTPLKKVDRVNCFPRVPLVVAASTIASGIITMIGGLVCFIVFNSLMIVFPLTFLILGVVLVVAGVCLWLKNRISVTPFHSLVPVVHHAAVPLRKLEEELKIFRAKYTVDDVHLNFLDLAIAEFSEELGTLENTLVFENPQGEELKILKEEIHQKTDKIEDFCDNATIYLRKLTELCAEFGSLNVLELLLSVGVKKDFLKILSFEEWRYCLHCKKMLSLVSRLEQHLTGRISEKVTTIYESEKPIFHQMPFGIFADCLKEISNPSREEMPSQQLLTYDELEVFKTKSELDILQRVHNRVLREEAYGSEEFRRILEEEQARLNYDIECAKNSCRQLSCIDSLVSQERYIKGLAFIQSLGDRHLFDEADQNDRIVGDLSTKLEKLFAFAKEESVKLWQSRLAAHSEDLKSDISSVLRSLGSGQVDIEVIGDEEVKILEDKKRILEELRIQESFLMSEFFLESNFNSPEMLLAGLIEKNKKKHDDVLERIEGWKQREKELSVLNKHRTEIFRKVSRHASCIDFVLRSSHDSKTLIERIISDSGQEFKYLATLSHAELQKVRQYAKQFLALFQTIRLKEELSSIRNFLTSETRIFSDLVKQGILLTDELSGVMTQMNSLIETMGRSDRPFLGISKENLRMSDLLQSLDSCDMSLEEEASTIDELEVLLRGLVSRDLRKRGP